MSMPLSSNSTLQYQWFQGKERHRETKYRYGLLTCTETILQIGSPVLYCLKGIMPLRAGV